MARSGQVSVDVVADFSGFAAAFQRDLNSALSRVRVNMTSVSSQLTTGIRSAVDTASTEFRRLGNQIDTQLSTGVRNGVTSATTELRRLTTQVDTQLSTGVRNGVTSANTELQRLANQSSTVFGQIGRQAVSTGTTISRAFSDAGRSVTDAGETMTAALTLPLTAFGALTIAAAGNFEKAMNRVKAVSGATAEEFAALREMAIDLGSTTQYSASQAAEAMGYLAMAGFDAEQTLEALPGVLNLAAAGAIDLADAADIASNILSGYGFQASQIGEINDILAKTFTSTNTTLASLGDTFKYVGPVAASAGVAFTEISAAIGLLGNAGIQGSEAGTALRGAIARLLKPTKEVTTTLNELGVTVVDSTGTLLPLVDIVRQLEEAGASTADMMAIFGLEAGPAMQALVSQGSDALAELTAELENAGGTADRIASIQMEGFNGAMDELRSAVEGLMIAIGDAGLLGWMTSLAEHLTTLTAAAAELSPGFLRVATIAGIVLAALGPLFVIIGRTITAIAEAALAFGKFGKWLLKVAPWLSALSGPIGWVIAGVVALGAALVIAYRRSERFRSVVTKVFSAVSNAVKTAWRKVIKPAFDWIADKAMAVGEAIAGLWRQARPVFTALRAAVQQVWYRAIKPGLDGIIEIFGEAGGAIADFWRTDAGPALSSLVDLLSDVGGAVRDWWEGNGDTVMAAAADAVERLGDVMTTVFKGIMTVWKAFATVIKWVIKNVSIPLWKWFIDVIKTVVKTVASMENVWEVVGAVVVAAVKAAAASFKFLWKVALVVFPVVASVIKWWWKNIIVPVFTGLGVVIKAAMAVFLWMWRNVIKPVVRLIAAALDDLGVAAKWLWKNVIKPALEAMSYSLTATYDSVIKPVARGVVRLIDTIGDAISWLWDVFGPVVSLIVSALRGLWSVASAVFSGFASVVEQVWTSSIQPALSAMGAMVMWLYRNAIQPALSAAGATFTWLWNVVSPVISAIGRQLSWLWGTVQSIFSAIIGYVRNAVSAIVTIANGAQGFTTTMSSHFSRTNSAIQDRLSAAIRTVSQFPGAIVRALGNVGGILYNAGASIVNGLIRGIASRLTALRRQVSSLASTIRRYLPFSPAKEGPLSGRGDPTISGGKIVSMVAEGMRTKLPALRDASWGLADTVSTPVTGAVGGNTPIAGSLRGGTQIVFSSGAISVSFSGAVPTEEEAAATGAAVGQGIAAELSRSHTAALVRSI